MCVFKSILFRFVPHQELLLKIIDQVVCNLLDVGRNFFNSHTQHSQVPTMTLFKCVAVFNFGSSLKLRALFLEIEFGVIQCMTKTVSMSCSDWFVSCEVSFSFVCFRERKCEENNLYITWELWNFPPLTRGKQYKWLHPIPLGENRDR